MKTTILLLVSIFLYSCGSDSVVNNPVVPPPVHIDTTIILMQKDSISVGNAYWRKDSIQYTNGGDVVDTLRISCRLVFRDILHDLKFYVKINENNSIYTYSQNYDSAYSNDTTFNLFLLVNVKPFTFKAFLQASAPLFQSFATLYDIKLWYIKRS
jgi:hypothetical protein